MGLTDKLSSLIEVFQDFNENKGRYLADILAGREDELLGRQRDQLASGQDSYGDDLTPLYPDDLTYFRSRSAGERYRDWKLSINQPPRYGTQFPRNVDAPNLYVDGENIRNGGRFYRELAVVVDSDLIEFNGATAYADNIIYKYGLDKFGLNETFWRMVMENGVIDELLGKLRGDIQTI